MFFLQSSEPNGRIKFHFLTFLLNGATRPGYHAYIPSRLFKTPFPSTAWAPPLTLDYIFPRSLFLHVPHTLGATRPATHPFRGRYRCPLLTESARSPILHTMHFPLHPLPPHGRTPTFQSPPSPVAFASRAPFPPFKPFQVGCRFSRGRGTSLDDLFARGRGDMIFVCVFFFFFVVSSALPFCFGPPRLTLMRCTA